MLSFILFAMAPLVGALTPPDRIDWTLGMDGALHLSYGTIFQALNSDGSVKWTFNADSPIVTYKEGLKGTIHIVTQSVSKTNRTHYALGEVDGDIQWQRTSLDTGACEPDYVQLLFSDLSLYLVCKDVVGQYGLRIEAVDVAGAWKWTEAVPNATDIGVGPDGGVLVRISSGHPTPWERHQNTLSWLQPDNGAVKWTVKLDGEFAGWALSEGNIFVAPRRVGDWETTYYMLDLLLLNGAEGNILRNFSYGSVTASNRGSYPLSPISGSRGNVYVYVPAPNSVNLRAFDFTEDPLFTLHSNHSFQHSTWQTEEGYEEDVFATSYIEGRPTNQTDVVAYSGGLVLWNASIAGYFAVQSIGLSATVFATDAFNNHGIAIRNGHEVWRAPYFTKALLSKDDIAYLQHYDHDSQLLSVVAMDMNGTQKWSYPIVDPTDNWIIA